MVTGPPPVRDLEHDRIDDRAPAQILDIVVV